jgi:hypothetical protein
MKRLRYEDVKRKFEEEGYILLSNNYVNNKCKLDYICNKRHRHSITWSEWSRGRRCYYCGIDRRTNLKRLNFDIIQRSFNSENYILLVNKHEYVNVDQKLNFICLNGHKYAISWHNWNNGWRCKFCHHEKLSVLFSGEGNPQWKGGISCEPYCDIWIDKEYKESIKKRDNYECQNPNCWNVSNRLTIHHIDYNKKNCSPENLITLCNSCNVRANKDRSLHETLYKAIVLEKNYKVMEV